jgi:hypothetical protein
MHRKRLRPAHCEPWSITDVKELGARLRLSGGRMLASDLVHDGPAWRLWAACAEATFGYGREADQIYIATLAELARMKRQKAAPLMDRFHELGVFVWDKAPRGSHGISLLALPALSTCAPVGHMSGSTCAPVGHMTEPASDLHVPPGGTLQSNEAMSVEVELITHDSPIDTGTHHSTPLLSGSSACVEGSEDWHAERRASPGQAPEDWDDLKEAVRAAYGAEPEPDPVLAQVLARFGEPEPAAVTDTEAHRRRR